MGPGESSKSKRDSASVTPQSMSASAQALLRLGEWMFMFNADSEEPQVPEQAWINLARPRCGEKVHH